MVELLVVILLDLDAELVLLSMVVEAQCVKVLFANACWFF